MINLNKQKRQFKSQLRNIYRTMGNNGVVLFKIRNFEAQGFITSSGVEKWKQKGKKDSRKTLVGKTRKLRGTIGYVVRGNQIWFRSLADYAKRHNEGLGKMPKRQFMGDSDVLNKQNKKSIEKAIKKIMG